MIRLSGIFAIIPATMFLVVSFFVLFAAGKTESQGLKSFSRVLAGLLWIAAGLVLLVGLYILMTGQHPLVKILSEACRSCPMRQ